MFAIAASVLVCSSLLILYRAIKGPVIHDRVLSCSSLGTKVILIVVLLGFMDGNPGLYIDISLAYALINFIGVTAYLKYVQTAGRIDGESKP